MAPKRRKDPEEEPLFSSDDSIDSDDFDDDIEEDSDHEEVAVKPPPAPKVSRHLLQLKEKLGLDALKAKLSATASSNKKIVETSSSADGPLVVVYSDPSKRKKARQTKEQKSQEVGQRKKKEKVPQRPVFDIHQAKHEVRKLAISTMRKAGKQEARAALAISLGAIAPKAKAVHYKELKEAKRAEKEELQRRRQGDEVFASRVGQMARKPAARDDKKKKNNKNRVAGFDAGFGKASQAGRARAGLRK